MLNDLTRQIREWLDKGDQIILMLDLNDNVLNSEANTQLQSVGLEECILQRHDVMPLVATCNKGTNAIDCIYVSSTIRIQRGGYCPFNSRITEHSGLT
jgi:hypothetical protein